MRKKRINTKAIAHSAQPATSSVPSLFISPLPLSSYRVPHLEKSKGGRINSRFQKTFSLELYYTLYAKQKRQNSLWKSTIVIGNFRGWLLWFFRGCFAGDGGVGVRGFLLLFAETGDDAAFQLIERAIWVPAFAFRGACDGAHGDDLRGGGCG